MNIQNIQISNIPAILWGEKSERLIIAVHGNMSSKTDVPIAILAEEATSLGYRVLSFDLPAHGDRKNDPTLCKVQNCVKELSKVMNYAKVQASSISLLAISMGAYFSLLSYKDFPLEQCLLLSPVVNMQHIIENMMAWFHISEEQLLEEQILETPVGQTLYWDYYHYVKQNKIERWNTPTAVLYGKKDELCSYQDILNFVQKFGSKLDVSEVSQHYFHTTEDICVYRKWVAENLMK